MKRVTSGTSLYIIPLKGKWRLNQGFPLVISEDYDGSFTIECPAFDEYGYGATYQEALVDLGSSIIDLWRSLKRQRHLGGCLSKILNNLNESIVTKDN